MFKTLTLLTALIYLNYPLWAHEGSVLKVNVSGSGSAHTTIDNSLFIFFDYDKFKQLVWNQAFEELKNMKLRWERDVSPDIRWSDIKTNYKVEFDHGFRRSTIYVYVNLELQGTILLKSPTRTTRPASDEENEESFR